MAGPFDMLIQKLQETLMPGEGGQGTVRGAFANLADMFPQQQAGVAAQPTLDQLMSPGEKYLYSIHQNNLTGPGGVDNPDGSRSTLKASSFEDNGRTYMLPTVRDGKIVDNKTAFDAAVKDGLQKYPNYGSEEEAQTRYGQMHQLLEQETSQYQRKRAENSQPVSNMPVYQRALLNAIAAPESGGRYNVRYSPKGPIEFDESTGKHPAIYEAGPAGPSSAAGRYQITKSTWDSLGGGPFTRQAQDAKAWELAQSDYAKHTGRDLASDLQQQGFTPAIMSALSPTWAGLKDNPDKAVRAYEASLRFRPGLGQDNGQMVDNPPPPGRPPAKPNFGTGTMGPGGKYAMPDARRGSVRGLFDRLKDEETLMEDRQKVVGDTVDGIWANPEMRKALEQQHNKINFSSQPDCDSDPNCTDTLQQLKADFLNTHLTSVVTPHKNFHPKQKGTRDASTSRTQRRS